MRALTGRFHEDREEWGVFPKDSDGSAKVALIGIDNSPKAWENLNDHLKDSKDYILDVKSTNIPQ